MISVCLIHKLYSKVFTYKQVHLYTLPYYFMQVLVWLNAFDQIFKQNLHSCLMIIQFLTTYITATLKPPGR